MQETDQEFEIVPIRFDLDEPVVEALVFLAEGGDEQASAALIEHGAA